MRNSSIAEEQHFITVLFNRAADPTQDEKNHQLAKYIDNLPKGNTHFGLTMPSHSRSYHFQKKQPSWGLRKLQKYMRCLTRTLS